MIRGAVKAISRPATYQPNKSASGLSLSPPIAAKTMQATIKITTYALAGLSGLKNGSTDLPNFH